MITVATALPLTVIALSGIAYARGVGALWRRAGAGRGVGRLRVASFFAGLAVLAFALASPLEALAHVSFSMHMVQHVLLLLVAPPLLVAGSPLLPLLWSLPPDGRRRLGAAWRGARLLRRTWRALSAPLVVWSIGVVVLWAWHLPSLYQATLTEPWLHATEHFSLLAASCLFWWLVLQPIGRPRVHGGVALLVVFGTKVQSTVLATLITFAPQPLYPAYGATADRLPRSLLEDQQLAGVIMGWPMALVYLGAAAGLFLSWLRTIDRRVERPPRAPPTPSR